MPLRPLVSCLVTSALAAALVGCGADAGGAAPGPADKHCEGKKPQATSQKVCHQEGTADPSDYGPTMYGTEGDDDDCKYHVTWSSTDIIDGVNVSFTMKATKLTDGSPVTGSFSYIEAFLNDKHPAPNTTPPSTAKEDPPGTYTIEPILFDAKGKWTVRFHIFEQCADISPESPHGHAAFYVDVP